VIAWTVAGFAAGACTLTACGGSSSLWSASATAACLRHAPNFLKVAVPKITPKARRFAFGDGRDAKTWALLLASYRNSGGVARMTAVFTATTAEAISVRQKWTDRNVRLLRLPIHDVVQTKNAVVIWSAPVGKAGVAEAIGCLRR
jgi:hypothetical protein